MKDNKSKNQPVQKASSSKQTPGEAQQSNRMHTVKIIIGEGKHKIETHIAATSLQETILLRDPRGIFGVEIQKIESSGKENLDVYDNMDRDL